MDIPLLYHEGAIFDSPTIEIFTLALSRKLQHMLMLELDATYAKENPSKAKSCEYQLQSPVIFSHI